MLLHHNKQFVHTLFKLGFLSPQERVQGDHFSVLTDSLTSVRGINKTDVLTLSSSFGSLKNIINCSMEELSLCPGLGARKVKNLYDAFHTPLDSAKKKRQKTEESPQQIESFLKKMKDKKKDGKEDIQEEEEEEGDESLGKEEIELNEAEEEKGNNNNNIGTCLKQESTV